MPYWLQLIIFAIITGLVQYTVAYIKEKGRGDAIKKNIRGTSYEEEKGKALATREDIEEVTNLIETVRSEVSFENQRKHSYIEQRTERFIKVLRLTEELYLCQSLLLYHLYDLNSADKLSQLIEKINMTLLDLVHECRMLTVSIDNEEITDKVYNLINSSQEHAGFLCYIASNAITHLRERKTFFDLSIQKNEKDLFKRLLEHDADLMKIRKEFENRRKEKQDEFYDDVIKYLAALKRLFGKEFYLKLDSV